MGQVGMPGMSGRYARRDDTRVDVRSVRSEAETARPRRIQLIHRHVCANSQCNVRGLKHTNPAP